MTANATPQRLYLLQLGTADVPRGEIVVKMVLVAYLIQMSDGQNILIDTGSPEGFHIPGTPAMENDKNVLRHLVELGLKPDDISLLVCTHFDIDHVGHHEAFPNAELIVQRRHNEAARSGQERYASGRAHWDAPGLKYRLVDGDVELFPGLTLLETSGHAPGHQSVLVNLPQSGNILLAIDAVIMQSLFHVHRQALPADDNEAELRASTQKLLDIVEREKVSLVVFGHDGRQWQTLKKAPEFYE